MIYKNFRFSIIMRVILITVLSLLLAIVIVKRQTLFVPVVIGLALIAAIFNLISYIERANKDLTHFLLSIRQGAFTESYTSGQRGKPFEELSDALNDIIREFAKLNVEKELHYQYLQALNENIGVAILSFDENGNLLMMNPAAKRLLNQPLFNRIEDFRQIDRQLYEAVMQIKPEEKSIVRAFINEDQYQLSVQLKEIVLQNKKVQIVLIQNLNSELEAREIEAWHQLMRVLTHEIMNSVTPIISLTSAVQNILYHPDGSKKPLSLLNSENEEDIYNSLSTIASRSKGLLKFVNAYREYARPVELKREEADSTALMNRVVSLFTPDIQKYNISLKRNYPERPVIVKADVALIEQVFINIIKNAIEAVHHDGTGSINIDIKAKGSYSVSISIHDNGDGIDEETLPRIFVPFYTTKSTGSGIGLSLSRQIIKLHGGNIRVSSSPKSGTVFTIEWS